MDKTSVNITKVKRVGSGHMTKSFLASIITSHPPSLHFPDSQTNFFTGIAAVSISHGQ